MSVMDRDNESNAATATVDTSLTTPDAPAVFALGYTANGATDYTVTIPMTTGAEYSFDGTTWSNANTKSGYLPGETVTGYMRFAAVPSVSNASGMTSASVTLPLFKVQTPTANPVGGSFIANQSVTLASATAGASIYYTTDGSTPTTGSTLYSGAFTVTTTTTVKAIAVMAGMTNSDVMTEIFTIAPTTYTVTVNANGGSGSSGGGNYAAGATVTINAGTRSGYNFSHWTASPSVSFANANSASATFTIPAGAVTVTANWTPTGGNGNNGGNNGGNNNGGWTPTPSPSPSPSPTPTPDPTSTPDTIPASGNGQNMADMPVEVDKDTGEVTVLFNKESKETIIADAFDHADEHGGIPTVTLDFSKVENATSVIMGADVLEVFNEAGVAVTLVLPGAELTLNLDALGALTEANAESFTVQAAIIPMSDLRGMQAAQVKGYETVINIDVFAGNKKIDVPLTISLPYKLKAGENAKAVRVWHMADNGNLTCMKGVFNTATGMITFTANHQSYYVVGYDEVALWINVFSDIAEGAWYYDAVAYANHHGLFSGYGNGIFGAQDSMTRAMFVTVLYKLENSPAITGTRSFTDVAPGMWYHDAVIWAAENGIVSGVGDNRYAPDRPITRQEMAVMLYNYANFKGIEIPAHRELPYFRDSHEIDLWAETAAKKLAEAGVISGSNDEFMPRKEATRAEVAQMFKNFLRFIVGDR